MADEAKHNIKNNDPEAYKFFVNYWKLLKKYYIVQDDNLWWDCFVADLSRYVNAYAYSDFYVDLVMALYHRNVNEFKQHDIKYISEFFKDWWNVLDTYYMPLKDNPNLQGPFAESIQKLYKKYEYDPFLIDCIDIMYNYKMPAFKTADSLRFVKEIYGLS